MADYSSLQERMNTRSNAKTLGMYEKEYYETFKEQGMDKEMQKVHNDQYDDNMGIGSNMLSIAKKNATSLGYKDEDDVMEHKEDAILKAYARTLAEHKISLNNYANGKYKEEFDAFESEALSGNSESFVQSMSMAGGYQKDGKFESNIIQGLGMTTRSARGMATFGDNWYEPFAASFFNSIPLLNRMFGSLDDYDLAVRSLYGEEYRTSTMVGGMIGDVVEMAILTKFTGGASRILLRTAEKARMAGKSTMLSNLLSNAVSETAFRTGVGAISSTAFSVINQAEQFEDWENADPLRDKSNNANDLLTAGITGAVGGAVNQGFKAMDTSIVLKAIKDKAFDGVFSSRLMNGVLDPLIGTLTDFAIYNVFSGMDMVSKENDMTFKLDPDNLNKSLGSIGEVTLMNVGSTFVNKLIGFKGAFNQKRRLIESTSGSNLEFSKGWRKQNKQELNVLKRSLNYALAIDDDVITNVGLAIHNQGKTWNDVLNANPIVSNSMDNGMSRFWVAADMANGRFYKIMNEGSNDIENKPLADLIDNLSSHYMDGDMLTLDVSRLVANDASKNILRETIAERLENPELSVERTVTELAQGLAALSNVNNTDEKGRGVIGQVQDNHPFVDFVVRELAVQKLNKEIPGGNIPESKITSEMVKINKAIKDAATDDTIKGTPGLKSLESFFGVIKQKFVKSVTDNKTAGNNATVKSLEDAMEIIGIRKIASMSMLEFENLLVQGRLKNQQKYGVFYANALGDETRIGKGEILLNANNRYNQYIVQNGGNALDSFTSYSKVQEFIKDETISYLDKIQTKINNISEAQDKTVTANALYKELKRAISVSSLVLGDETANKRMKLIYDSAMNKGQTALKTVINGDTLEKRLIDDYNDYKEQSTSFNHIYGMTKNYVRSFMTGINYGDGSIPDMETFRAKMNDVVFKNELATIDLPMLAISKEGIADASDNTKIISYSEINDAHNIMLDANFVSTDKGVNDIQMNALISGLAYKGNTIIKHNKIISKNEAEAYIRIGFETKPVEFQHDTNYDMTSYGNQYVELVANGNNKYELSGDKKIGNLYKVFTSAVATKAKHRSEVMSLKDGFNDTFGNIDTFMTRYLKRNNQPYLSTDTLINTTGNDPITTSIQEEISRLSSTNKHVVDTLYKLIGSNTINYDIGEKAVGTLESNLDNSLSKTVKFLELNDKKFNQLDADTKTTVAAGLVSKFFNTQIQSVNYTVKDNKVKLRIVEGLTGSALYNAGMGFMRVSISNTDDHDQGSKTTEDFKNVSGTIVKKLGLKNLGMIGTSLSELYIMDTNNYITDIEPVAGQPRDFNINMRAVRQFVSNIVKTSESSILNDQLNIVYRANGGVNAAHTREEKLNYIFNSISKNDNISAIKLHDTLRELNATDRSQYNTTKNTTPTKDVMGDYINNGQYTHDIKLLTLETMAHFKDRSLIDGSTNKVDLNEIVQYVQGKNQYISKRDLNAIMLATASTLNGGVGKNSLGALTNIYMAPLKEATKTAMTMIKNGLSNMKVFDASSVGYLADSVTNLFNNKDVLINQIQTEITKIIDNFTPLEPTTDVDNLYSTMKENNVKTDLANTSIKNAKHVEDNEKDTQLGKANMAVLSLILGLEVPNYNTVTKRLTGQLPSAKSMAEKAIQSKSVQEYVNNNIFNNGQSFKMAFVVQDKDASGEYNTNGSGWTGHRFQDLLALFVNKVGVKPDKYNLYGAIQKLSFVGSQTQGNRFKDYDLVIDSDTNKGLSPLMEAMLSNSFINKTKAAIVEIEVKKDGTYTIFSRDGKGNLISSMPRNGINYTNRLDSHITGMDGTKFLSEMVLNTSSISEGQFSSANSKVASQQTLRNFNDVFVLRAKLKAVVEKNKIRLKDTNSNIENPTELNIWDIVLESFNNEAVAGQGKLSVQVDPNAKGVASFVTPNNAIGSNAFNHLNKDDNFYSKGMSLGALTWGKFIAAQVKEYNGKDTKKNKEAMNALLKEFVKKDKAVSDILERNGVVNDITNNAFKNISERMLKQAVEMDIIQKSGDEYYAQMVRMSIERPDQMAPTRINAITASAMRVGIAVSGTTKVINNIDFDGDSGILYGLSREEVIGHGKKFKQNFLQDSDTKDSELESLIKIYDYNQRLVVKALKLTLTTHDVAKNLVNMDNEMRSALTGVIINALNKESIMRSIVDYNGQNINRDAITKYSGEGKEKKEGNQPWELIPDQTDARKLSDAVTKDIEQWTSGHIVTKDNNGQVKFLGTVGSPLANGDFVIDKDRGKDFNAVLAGNKIMIVSKEDSKEMMFTQKIYGFMNVDDYKKHIIGSKDPVSYDNVQKYIAKNIDNDLFYYNKMGSLLAMSGLGVDIVKDLKLALIANSEDETNELIQHVNMLSKSMVFSEKVKLYVGIDESEAENKKFSLEAYVTKRTTANGKTTDEQVKENHHATGNIIRDAIASTELSPVSFSLKTIHKWFSNSFDVSELTFDQINKELNNLEGVNDPFVEQLRVVRDNYKNEIAVRSSDLLYNGVALRSPFGGSTKVKNVPVHKFIKSYEEFKRIVNKKLITDLIKDKSNELVHIGISDTNDLMLKMKEKFPELNITKDFATSVGLMLGALEIKFQGENKTNAKGNNVFVNKVVGLGDNKIINTESLFNQASKIYNSYDQADSNKKLVSKIFSTIIGHSGNDVVTEAKLLDMGINSVTLKQFKNDDTMQGSLINNEESFRTFMNTTVDKMKKDLLLSDVGRKTGGILDNTELTFCF